MDQIAENMDSLTKSSAPCHQSNHASADPSQIMVTLDHQPGIKNAQNTAGRLRGRDDDHHHHSAEGRETEDIQSYLNKDHKVVQDLGVKT